MANSIVFGFEALSETYVELECFFIVICKNLVGYFPSVACALYHHLM